MILTRKDILSTYMESVLLFFKIERALHKIEREIEREIDYYKVPREPFFDFNKYLDNHLCLKW